MYVRACLVGILVACVSASSLFFLDGSAQGSDTVTLTLRITDATSGLSLNADKQVAQGANAVLAGTHVLATVSTDADVGVAGSRSGCSVQRGSCQLVPGRQAEVESFGYRSLYCPDCGRQPRDGERKRRAT